MFTLFPIAQSLPNVNLPVKCQEAAAPAFHLKTQDAAETGTQEHGVSMAQTSPCSLQPAQADAGFNITLDTTWQPLGCETIPLCSI